MALYIIINNNKITTFNGKTYNRLNNAQTHTHMHAHTKKKKNIFIQSIGLIRRTGTEGEKHWKKWVFKTCLNDVFQKLSYGRSFQVEGTRHDNDLWPNALEPEQGFPVHVYQGINEGIWRESTDNNKNTLFMAPHLVRAQSTYTHFITHTHAHTLSLSHTHSLSLTHALSLSLTHTHYKYKHYWWWIGTIGRKWQISMQ